MAVKQLPRVAIVLALAIPAVSCSVDAQSLAATGMFQRVLTVTGPVDLEVQTGSGSIQIRRGGNGQVQVVGHVRAQRGFWNGPSAEERIRRVETAPPIVQNGNALRLGDRTESDVFRNVSISYEVTVPGDTTVRSRSGSGSLAVDSIDGSVDARTGSGSINVGSVGGAVDASSGSGSIDVRASGGLNASTGSGRIRARQVAGNAKANSGSGSIDVEYANVGDGEFGTGSGTISVTGARAGLRAHAGSGSILITGSPASNWAIDTGSGSITVRLPIDAAFDLDARSNSGGVTTNHPIEVVGTVLKRRVQGRVRGGGPLLRVEAGSGSIRLD